MNPRSRIAGQKGNDEYLFSFAKLLSLPVGLIPGYIPTSTDVSV